MITIKQIPPASIEAARLAMAEALANDGDGIPECIAAAVNKWPGMERQGFVMAWRTPRIILPLEEPANDN